MKLAQFAALTAVAVISASAPANADGALAVGSTSNIAKDGIAVGSAMPSLAILLVDRQLQGRMLRDLVRSEGGDAGRGLGHRGDQGARRGTCAGELQGHGGRRPKRLLRNRGIEVRRAVTVQSRRPNGS